MPVPTKTCTKCKRNLELIHFGVKTKAKDGLSPTCRECIRTYTNKKARTRPDFGEGKTKHFRTCYSLASKFDPNDNLF